MNEPAYTVTRDVTRKECRWLESDVPAGTVLYEYWGYTYGCIHTGIAMSKEPGKEPFFEMPRDALSKRNCIMIKEVTSPIADLEDVRKAVFGDVGDEPDIYADYDRLSATAGKMRQAIETLQREAWQDISMIPADGTRVEIWGKDFDYPEVIYWEKYEASVVEEAGAEGYWRYAEELLADVADVDFGTLTHWRHFSGPGISK